MAPYLRHIRPTEGIVEERRRHVRCRVAWSVRLWLSEYCFLAGRAIDVSAHGACVHLNWSPSETTLRPCEVYQLDLYPDTRGEFPCVGVIRHVNDQVVGLEILEELPIGRRAQ